MQSVDAAPAVVPSLYHVVAFRGRWHETVGGVMVGPGNWMTAVSVIRGRERWLERILDDMNDVESLFVACPRDPCGIASDICEPVGRQDPRFIDAAIRHLEDFRGARLVLSGPVPGRPALNGPA